MNNFIFGYDEWTKAYNLVENRKKIWIYIKFNNSVIIYLKDYKDWKDVQQYCNLNNLSIVEIGLQYKSHKVTRDTTISNGIYLVTSIRGQFGGNTRQCFTIGILINNLVKKIMISTPELIIEDEFEDTLENCFKEAIVYYEPRKTKT